MRNKICSKSFLHLVFFISSLLLQWFKMTNSIPIHYDLLEEEEGSSDYYKCLDKERDALLSFKASISNDPYGYLSDWTREEEKEGATNNCCYWSWITCNDDSHVIRLYLGEGGLEGKISHSLLNLTYLDTLDLDGNSFSGTIPIFIGSMTPLEFLHLGGNDFTGAIPLEFGNLTNLQHLFLDGFSLAKDDKWVNIITSLPNLQDLSLVGCDLSQVTHPPYSYPSINLSSVVSLDLSDNKLDGIPKYFGNLCGLKYLYFDDNSISIKFSDFLDNFSGCTSVALLKLYASRNQLPGSLPDGIQIFSALQVLVLVGNQLNETVSEKLWELPDLVSLVLSSNSLHGAISKIIGKSKLMTIDLSNNSLNGSLDDMSNNFMLQEIYLSSNNIYGFIPSVSSTLTILDFSNNRLLGNISFLCKIVDSSLVILDLSNNSLTGQIPDCLWHFRKLRVLNLGVNKLFGKLPASIGSLTSIEGLYLNNNNLNGDLPSSLKNLTKLSFIYVGVNMFSGNVPFWIGEELSLLETLSLTSNNFHGTIPLQLCQLVELKILDLSINNLNGTIPTCLNNLSAMLQDSHGVSYFQDRKAYECYIRRHVKIAWQGTQREITSTLQLRKIIDLSHNKLTGKIPGELTALHKLVALNLSMNALHGEIPSKISLMKELQILDVSKNNLSGRIPSNMSEMNSLDYLDLSYNNLSGRIPTGTQLQSFESSMYTGNEGLCGLPLMKDCPGDKDPSLIGQSEAEGEGIDELERWFYIGGATGFSIGFWIICSGLLLYRRGRHAFFHYMNRLEDWAYVEMMVLIAKLNRITHP